MSIGTSALNQPKNKPMFKPGTLKTSMIATDALPKLEGIGITARQAAGSNMNTNVDGSRLPNITDVKKNSSKSFKDLAKGLAY